MELGGGAMSYTAFDNGAHIHRTGSQRLGGPREAATPVAPLKIQPRHHGTNVGPSHKQVARYRSMSSGPFVR